MGKKIKKSFVRYRKGKMPEHVLIYGKEVTKILNKKGKGLYRYEVNDTAKTIANIKKQGFKPY